MTGHGAGVGLAVALAAVGAGCFAVAGALQHRAVSAAAGPHVGFTAVAVRVLVRRPRWLAGLGLAAGGAGLHVVALTLAPVSVVQPVGVLAVPFAVVLAARRARARPRAGVLGAVTATVAGVAAFVGLAAGTAVSGPVDSSAVVVMAGVVAAVVVCGGVAARGSGRLRCLGCATSGAVAFGVVSTLLRALTQQIGAGGVGLTDPGVLGSVAEIVVAMAVGGWLVQQALASGPSAVVIACLTVIDPMVAVALGVLLLGEGAATGATTAVAMGGCALVAAAGVLALARHHPDAVVPSPDPEPADPEPADPEPARPR